MATAQSKTQLLLDGGEVTKIGGGDLSRAPLLHFQAFFFQFYLVLISLFWL